MEQLNINSHQMLLNIIAHNRAILANHQAEIVYIKNLLERYGEENRILESQVKKLETGKPTKKPNRHYTKQNTCKTIPFFQRRFVGSFTSN
jgi:hypothetical protein